jgi:ABC-type lipoprotein export system ATPase subunit
MQLHIGQLLPVYFQTKNTSQSEIWNKDLEIGKGELVKIIAPSGSGKTSLVSFLYGMRGDYTGHIRFDKKDIRTLSPEALARLRKDHLSIVFQDLRLFPDQTVEENLEIKRQLNPYHPPAKIGEMTTRLGIGDKLKSKMSTCSYGEQQRVAIIRSLLQPFDILLLDEPFSHLDTKNAERAMELMLEEAKSRQATIIFADLERIDYFPYTRLFHL